MVDQGQEVMEEVTDMDPGTQASVLTLILTLIITLFLTLVEVSPYMVLYVGNGTLVPVLMVPTVSVGIAARHARMQVSWESSTRLLPMTARVPGLLSRFSKGPILPSFSWDTETYLKVHRLVRRSGKYNFEGCRIPVPTAIRYDRIEESLGSEATSKDFRVLDQLPV